MAGGQRGQQQGLWIGCIGVAEIRRCRRAGDGLAVFERDGMVTVKGVRMLRMRFMAAIELLQSVRP